MAGVETKIEFTKLALSDMEYHNQDIASLTSLEDIRQESAFESVTAISDDTVELIANVENKEVEQGFYVNTIGIYAKDKSETEILYAAVDCTENPDFQPAYQNMAIDRLHYSFKINVGTSANVHIESVPVTDANEVNYKNDKYPEGSTVKDILDTLGDMAKLASEYQEDNDTAFYDTQASLSALHQELAATDADLAERHDTVMSALDTQTQGLQDAIDAFTPRLSATIKSLTDAKSKLETLSDVFDATTNEWGDDLHVTGNLTVDKVTTGTGGFKGNLTGNVTGNVTGNLTGTASEATHAKSADNATSATSATSATRADTAGTADTAKACSGNAATATKATNADHATNADTCKTCSGNAATATTATNANHATNADSATKATNDGNNRNIVNTYATVAQVNELKNLSSDGKSKIAAAITSKGGTANSGMTWSQLATAINNIQTSDSIGNQRALAWYITKLSFANSSGTVTASQLFDLEATTKLGMGSGARVYAFETGRKLLGVVDLSGSGIQAQKYVQFTSTGSVIFHGTLKDSVTNIIYGKIMVIHLGTTTNGENDRLWLIESVTSDNQKSFTSPYTKNVYNAQIYTDTTDSTSYTAFSCTVYKTQESFAFG